MPPISYTALPNKALGDIYVLGTSRAQPLTSLCPKVGWVSRRNFAIGDKFKRYPTGKIRTLTFSYRASSPATHNNNALYNRIAHRKLRAKYIRAVYTYPSARTSRKRLYDTLQQPRQRRSERRSPYELLRRHVGTHTRDYENSRVRTRTYTRVQSLEKYKSKREREIKTRAHEARDNRQRRLSRRCIGN